MMYLSTQRELTIINYNYATFQFYSFLIPHPLNCVALCRVITAVFGNPTEITRKFVVNTIKRSCNKLERAYFTTYIRFSKIPDIDIKITK